MAEVIGKFFIFCVALFLSACNTTGSASNINALQSEARKDKDGGLYLEELHARNKCSKRNPCDGPNTNITLSDHSIVGNKSFRFELAHGDCGPKDCNADRERAELYYQWKTKSSLEVWKQEKWYRFYIFIPQDYNNIAPAKTSLIQWKGVKPSKDVLVMIQTHHGGLYFNHNGDTFDDRWWLLKNDKDMRGKWTEIVFNTNWHPNEDKGFMKVWIDGQMKVDYKGIANTPNGKGLSLRYGLYSSFLSRYEEATGNKITPKRVVYFDGVRGDTSCKKVLKDKEKCNNLLSQTAFQKHVDVYSLK